MNKPSIIKSEKYTSVSISKKTKQQQHAFQCLVWMTSAEFHTHYADTWDPSDLPHTGIQLHAGRPSAAWLSLTCKPGTARTAHNFAKNKCQLMILWCLTCYLDTSLGQVEGMITFKQSRSKERLAKVDCDGKAQVKSVARKFVHEQTDTFCEKAQAISDKRIRTLQ